MLWFLEVPTWSASVRTPHALLPLWVALRTFTITPASAQWTPLPALGQSTRAVAKEPAVLAIAKSARLAPPSALIKARLLPSTTLTSPPSSVSPPVRHMARMIGTTSAPH